MPRLNDQAKFVIVVVLMLLVGSCIVAKDSEAVEWPFDEVPKLDIGAYYEFDGESTYCPGPGSGPDQRFVGHLSLRQEFFDRKFWVGYQHHSCVFEENDKNSFDALGVGVTIPLGKTK